MSMNSLSQTLVSHGDFQINACSVRSRHAYNSPWRYLFLSTNPVFLHRAQGRHAARSFLPWKRRAAGVGAERWAALLGCQIWSQAKLSWTPEEWKRWWVVRGSRSWTLQLTFTRVTAGCGVGLSVYVSSFVSSMSWNPVRLCEWC